MANKKNVWPEIQQVIEKRNQNLKLTGDKVNERVIQNNGQLDPTLYKLNTILHKLEITNIRAFEVLPPEIGQLVLLKELILSENKLHTIPAEIGKLVELKNLILGNNSIVQLPDPGIGLLKNLQVLNLCGNQLVNLPQDFSQLHELITLNLSNNQLKEVPAHICNLPRLSTLNLCHNLIEQVSDSIVGLTALQNLDLGNNRLEEVPAVLGNLSKLKEINLNENPFKDKKFLKLLQGGKAKNILQQLKKIAPKPAIKDEAPPKPPPIVRIENGNDGLMEVRVSKDMSVRPYILLVVFKKIHFTEATYKQFIDLQTDLHQSLCKKRTVATIGTHDLTKIQQPFRYEARAPQNLRFVPLKGADKQYVYGNELQKYFERQNDASMLKYLSMISKSPVWPVVVDDTGEVISLPPVLNSKYSAISPESTSILVECTSSVSVAACKEVMAAFIQGTVNIFQNVHTPNNNNDNKSEEEDSPSMDGKYQLVLEQVLVSSEEGNPFMKYPLHRDIEDMSYPASDDDDD